MYHRILWPYALDSIVSTSVSAWTCADEPDFALRNSSTRDAISELALIYHGSETPENLHIFMWLAFIVSVLSLPGSPIEADQSSTICGKGQSKYLCRIIHQYTLSLRCPKPLNPRASWELWIVKLPCMINRPKLFSSSARSCPWLSSAFMFRALTSKRAAAAIFAANLPHVAYVLPRWGVPKKINAFVLLSTN